MKRIRAVGDNDTTTNNNSSSSSNTTTTTNDNDNDNDIAVWVEGGQRIRAVGEGEDGGPDGALEVHGEARRRVEVREPAARPLPPRARGLSRTRARMHGGAGGRCARARARGQKDAKPAHSPAAVT